MATSIATPIRFGTDVSGATDALWLPTYAGEVILAFEEKNIFADKVETRTISGFNTTGANFPRLWKIGSQIHEVGHEMLGLDVESSEITITADERPLVVPYEFDDVDRLFSHYDAMAPVAKEAGAELARQYDRRVAAMLINASRDTGHGSFPGGGIDGGGTAIVDNHLATADQDGALAVLNSLTDLTVYWDENDVPEEERWCAIAPALWQQVKLLGWPVAAADIAAGQVPYMSHGDWQMANPKLDTAGFGQVIKWNGWNIVKSNHLPTTNVASGPARYQGNFTNTKGICWQKKAIGVVNVMTPMVETDRDVRRGVDFFVTKMLMGGGTVYPILACELASA